MFDVVLGPCACQACGRPLIWDGAAWYFAGTRILHVMATCPGSDGRVRVELLPIVPRWPRSFS